MYPELFRVPFFNNFPVRSYGVLLVIGVVLAIYMARRRAPRYGIEPDRIWDASMWMVIPGIFGARIFYIAQYWKYYQAHQDQLYSLRFEGLTSFGGLVFGFLGFLLWRMKSKVNMWSFLDTVGVPVLVAQAVGRVGCLFNGCCYGRPTEAWYGVHFHDIPGRHVPAQVVDVVLMLVGALIVVFLEKRTQLKPGASFGWFLTVYGGSRFVYEMFRAGTRAEMDAGIASSAYIPGLPITGAQLGSIAMALVGVVCVFAARNRTPNTVVTNDGGTVTA